MCSCNASFFWKIEWARANQFQRVRHREPIGNATQVAGRGERYVAPANAPCQPFYANTVSLANQSLQPSGRSRAGFYRTGIGIRWVRFAVLERSAAIPGILNRLHAGSIT